jgi:hypothetical protein
MAPSTRRELILRGATVAGLAGFGGGAAANEADAAAAGGDRAELQSLVVVEQLSAFAYAQIVGEPNLLGGSSAQLRSFLAQEREHVQRLSAALSGLGGTVPPAPGDVASASRQLAALHVPGSLKSLSKGDDAVRYLIGVETLAEGAYFSAMSRLSDQRLLVLAAQIMSCEAQHWTALSGILHAGDIYRGVPYPVVLG